MKVMSFLITICIVVWAFCALPPQEAIAASSQTEASAILCNSFQESVGLSLPDFAVQQHDGMIIDVDVHYRIKTTPESQANDYPDYIPIVNQIKGFLSSYPNKMEYWEILNKRLAEKLLDSYPQLTAVTQTISVHGNKEFPYRHFSRISLVRPGQCPLTH